MTVRSHLALGLAAVAVTFPHPVLANLLQERSQRFHPVESSAGIVAAQEAQAAAVGAQILREGGNAVDAAVATSFALAVTLPQAGNLGGGGFLLLWLPKRGPMATCAAVFLYVYLPETKGKSLEAMYKYFEEITDSDLTKPFTPSPTRAVLADRTAGATVRESDNKIV